MASEAMALCCKGKRKYTRGWTGAAYVKRATSKRARRLAREALKDGGEGEITKPLTRGWVW
jgi:hypothetical protein